MRHWHPELSPLERRAAKFLFDCLDNPTPEGIKWAQREAKESLLGGAGGKSKGKSKGKKGGKGAGASAPRGFGKPAA